MIDSPKQMRIVDDRVTLIDGMLQEMAPILGRESASYRSLRTELARLIEAMNEAPFISCSELRKKWREGYSGSHCTPSCGHCNGTDWIPA